MLSTICKVLPKIRSCIHFYKNVWSEGDTHGVSIKSTVLPMYRLFVQLYVTGLTLGEDSTLCLADLIYGAAV